jgi:hypothetical protein
MKELVRLGKRGKLEKISFKDLPYYHHMAKLVVTGTVREQMNFSLLMVSTAIQLPSLL